MLKKKKFKSQVVQTTFYSTQITFEFTYPEIGFYEILQNMLKKN